MTGVQTCALPIYNWKKHTQDAEKEATRKRRQEDIKKAREAAQRFRQLEGKGLADEDDPEEGAASWVKKMKKRQKKKADELARDMEEELERQAREMKEYTAAELKGLKVSHDLGALEEMGGETILTLKDATVDENEGMLFRLLLLDTGMLIPRRGGRRARLNRSHRTRTTEGAS